MKPYGGFWIRFVAAFLDGLIIGVPLILVRAAVAPESLLEPQEGPTFDPFTPVQIVVGWLYAAVLESSPYQATVGKMATGLKVTDLDGRRISFGRATGRHFAKILSAIILLIGYLMVGWTRRKQGLHDMLAGTLVYKKDHLPRAAEPSPPEPIGRP